MKHVVKFTPHKPLGRLEAQKGRRYSYMDIAKVMDDDRQKIRYQLSNPVIEIKTTMIDKWLEFFDHEGMPITIADLFTDTGITGAAHITLDPLVVAATGKVETPSSTNE